MNYPWKVETMRMYVERRGEEFRRDLFDKTITQRAMEAKHGLNQSQVSLLRTGLVPEEQRRRHKHVITPEMLTAFETKATNKQLAKRFKIPYGTMERLRRRYFGTRHTPEVRLTPQVMAMLGSTFSNRRVAVALNVHACTIWELRIKLKLRTPKVKTVITEEQRDILASSRSYVEASARLGVGRNTIRRWYFLVQEGLL